MTRWVWLAVLVFSACPSVRPKPDAGGLPDGSIELGDGGSRRQPTVSCEDDDQAVYEAGDAGDAGAVAPGWVLRCARFELSDGGARFAGAKSFRFSYASRLEVKRLDGGLEERPLTLTALAIIPERLGAGERALVVDAVGPVGLLPRCAPSLLGAFDARVREDLADVLPGAVVVVPDLAGAGIDQSLRASDSDVVVERTLAPFASTRPLAEVSHAFLSMEAEGRALIDAVRAAQALPNANLPLRPKWVALGASEGGHAALAAGEVWTAGYGRDTGLLGVMAGAPLSGLEDRSFVLQEVERALWPVLLAGVSVHEPSVRSTELLSRQGQSVMAETFAEVCVSPTTAWPAWVAGASRVFADGGVLFERQPEQVPEVRAALAKNSPGARPTEVPVFIGQVDGDPIVDARRTQRLVAAERSLNPASVTDCVYESANPGAPWVDRLTDHQALAFMFGVGVGQCTGPDGQPTTVLAAQWLAERFEVP